MLFRTITALILGLSLSGMAAAQEARLRTGASSSSGAQTADGLDVHVFARGLGQISDMARAPDGTLFVADQKSGRIWVIRDRGLDGAADTLQALPHRFDLPSGLALNTQTEDGPLFVADRNGVWRLDGAGTPALLAPFANAGALDVPHPIALAADGSLHLGLTRADGTAHLLKLAVASGEATLLGTTPGTFIGFSKGPDKAPLLHLVRRGDKTALGTSFDALDTLSLAATSVWVDPAINRLVIGSETGVEARAASILGLSEEADTLLSGFSAGPIVIDERGLFVATAQDGSLRLIRPQQRSEDAGMDERAKSLSPTIMPEPTLEPEPLILRGSGIGEASEIDDYKD